MVSSSRRRRGRVSVGGGVSDGGSSTSSLSVRAETLTPPSGLVADGEGGGARQASVPASSASRFMCPTRVIVACVDCCDHALDSIVLFSVQAVVG